MTVDRRKRLHDGYQPKTRIPRGRDGGTTLIPPSPPLSRAVSPEPVSAASSAPLPFCAALTSGRRGVQPSRTILWAPSRNHELARRGRFRGVHEQRRD